MRKTKIWQCSISLLVAILLVSMFVHVTEAQKPLKFVYVSAHPIEGDDYWLMGKTGTEQAGKKHGAEVQILECEHPEEGEEKLRMAAREGASIIIVFTYEFHAFLTQVAADYPDVQFLDA